MESGRIFCLSVLSAKSKKTLIRKPPKCRKETTILNQDPEPYQITRASIAPCKQKP